MRRKLLKVMVAVILMVSVFLCNSFVSEAASAPGPFDNYISIGSASTSGNLMLTFGYQTYDQVNYPDGPFRNVYSYSGTSVYVIRITNNYSSTLYFNGFYSIYLYYSYVVPNNVNGSSVAIYGSHSSGEGYVAYTMPEVVSVSSGSPSPVFCRLYLSDFAIAPGTTAAFPVTCDLEGYVYLDTRTSNAGYRPSYISVNFSTASDFSDRMTITDKPLGSAGYISDNVGAFIDNSTTTIINNADDNNKAVMEQQQQIADQQAEQSRQQHNEQLRGYDNSSDNAMLDNKNQELTDLENMQDSAFDSANAGVIDYQKNYDVTPFVNLAPSFALIQVWFTLLWSGIGPFAPVLAVSLSLCVAGYIIKIKH